ncbi:hypothetical protein AK812_SmicGene27846 [Symbiodinium microadriaticum]|uniref:Uncharacterized protein n=1 Tax=Symbiodinium microadriaticum TaxID=2951 RepID=A0A1Q9D662_SYMMI|nr:hypothetical protein AK812_SmicGene27846 [Symbiodinium microadriaticum]
MARSHQQLPVVRQLRRPLVENRFAVFVKMTAIWHRAWSRTLFTAGAGWNWNQFCFTKRLQLTLSQPDWSVLRACRITRTAWSRDLFSPCRGAWKHNMLAMAQLSVGRIAEKED